MVKFAHIADCHLGSWRQQELQDLNFLSFQKVIDRTIEEKVDFALIAGDLFDSAYPPIEILKETFAEFKKLKDAKIPVYLIAGSHDYSASGKTFLDVIEKAGFCTNVENTEIQEDGRIKLIPSFFEDIAIYGYPGRKSGLEIGDLQKVYFEGNHQRTIFMMHSTINDIVGNIDMNSIDKKDLPIADYYAMGHIHQIFSVEENNSTFVYPGPTYPNNFQELVDLQCGSFQITEFTDKIRTTSIKIPMKEVAFIDIEIDNALTATETIIERLNKVNLNDKILLLKLHGTLYSGKSGDIRFNEIEEFVKKKQVYSYLRNISQLKTRDSGIGLTSDQIGNVEEVERSIQKEFVEKNPHNFNMYLPQLMNALSCEKNEDEISTIFETRILKLDEIL